MSKILKRLSITMAVLAASTAVALADFELNVLHFNDLHSRIQSINKYDSTCKAEDETEGKCFGGVARLKTAIDQRRKELADVKTAAEWAEQKGCGKDLLLRWLRAGKARALTASEQKQLYEVAGLKLTERVQD